MRVRLAFAVAAHLEPEILILDEVLAVGDAKFQEKSLNRIDEIKNSGVTILFVSHSTQSVLKLCTKGILLEEGRLVAQGTAKKLTDRYLESLHLSASEDGLAGYPESRTGRFAGQVAEFLCGNMNGGHLAFNIPVETSDGVRVVDVGWSSTARFQTMRTEPTWSAAPDICVSIVDRNKSLATAEHDIHHLLRSGAREAWYILPDGLVMRYKPQTSQFLIKQAPHHFSFNH
jgi:hypothetical protein